MVGGVIILPPAMGNGVFATLTFDWQGNIRALYWVFTANNAERVRWGKVAQRRPVRMSGTDGVLSFRLVVKNAAVLVPVPTVIDFTVGLDTKAILSFT